MSTTPDVIVACVLTMIRICVLLVATVWVPSDGMADFTVVVFDHAVVQVYALHV